MLIWVLNLNFILLTVASISIILTLLNLPSCSEENNLTSKFGVM